MSRFFISAALASGLLTGCLSPGDTCFAEATEEYRALRREARGIEADLARGHTVKTSALELPAPITCHEGGAMGICLITRAARIEIPVSIEGEVHRVRLSELRTRIARERPRAMAGAAACRAVDEGP